MANKQYHVYVTHISILLTTCLSALFWIFVELKVSSLIVHEFELMGISLLGAPSTFILFNLHAVGTVSYIDIG